MIYDLHTHSSASDGSLDPTALLRHAAACGVDVLAITDHDTLEAYDQVDFSAGGPRLVSGVELSTTWRGIGVHVVGLNIDLANDTLRSGVARQRVSRAERAQEIAARLRKLGLPHSLDAVREIAAGDYVGRPHFAQYLVAEGAVRNTRDAFRKFLGAGKVGDVKQVWQPLDDIVSWIMAAGGNAVLAHPARYRLTNSRLRSLAQDFRQAGGDAIEIVCGRQTDSTTRKLAELAKDLGLAASCGSDFHSPVNAWSRPGGFSQLPATVKPVWHGW